MIRVAVLTPHEAPGPEVEFAAMAPGRLATRVVRVTAEADGRVPSAAALDEISAATAAPVLERVAGQVLSGPADVLTSNQVLLWRLLAAAGDSVLIKGYGRLFKHKP